MNTKTKIVLCCSLAVLAAGCGRDISPTTYSESSVGETSYTYRGIVTNVRAVTVEGSERLQDNTVGLIGGGAAGALAGSAFGKGKGQLATALLGAAAGAAAGTYAEKALKQQKGLEYTVELDSGELRTVVQGPEPTLSVGQSVLLIVSQKGRSRLIADTARLR